MKKKATYLLPIWVDICCHGDPKDILIDLNEKLTEFFEKYGNAVARNSNSIDIQWSVNQHIELKIQTLSSAQPEIIRCRDCKHMIEHENYGHFGESAYTCEGNMVGWILPDDFCCYAERREHGRSNQQTGGN